MPITCTSISFHCFSFRQTYLSLSVYCESDFPIAATRKCRSVMSRNCQRLRPCSTVNRRTFTHKALLCKLLCCAYLQSQPLLIGWQITKTRRHTHTHLPTRPSTRLSTRRSEKRPRICDITSARREKIWERTNTRRIGATSGDRWPLCVRTLWATSKPRGLSCVRALHCQPRALLSSPAA